jgi:alpha-1,3-glucosyltransferase
VLEKGSLIVTTPQSEASKEINSILPEALRSRVLDYVQFQTTSRMDDLGKYLASNQSQSWQC